MDERKERGDRGEAAVADWLQARGCCLLERQFRCRYGEIDLIVRDREGTVCFIEVKTRSSSRFAQAREFVDSKGQGLDLEIQQGGSNLSGGQKQRLTIARALVRKPEILILDDSASALDFATDARLRQAIRNMPNAPTTFVVSQRAASVRYADLILVLEDGQVVGQGTHEELLKDCQVYQEIYYSQFPEEVKTHG